MSDSLGDRMKEYEAASKTRLTRRVPAVLRLDGKAFSSYTSGMLKPYDERFHRCMWSAAKYLCQNIVGAKLAYVQSDEISILLVDYDTHETQAYFDNQVQKIVSVSASMCAVQFYSTYLSEFPESERKNTLPAFDARVFSVPREDVANCLLWRQQDASRNSLSMLCQSLFSHKQLHGKDREAQHELLYTKGINWNDCPVPQKRGVCLLKETYTVPATSGGHPVLDPTTREFVSSDDVPAITTRSRWVVDKNIPIFSTPEGRHYINRFVDPLDDYHGPVYTESKLEPLQIKGGK